MTYQLRFAICALVCAFGPVSSAVAFEGRITATLQRGGSTQHLLYTISAKFVRIESLETNRPHACNLVNLQTGETTLLFRHNRSFVRLRNPEAGAMGEVADGAPGRLSDFGKIPAVPPAVASVPPTQVGPSNLPGGAPAPHQMPAMSQMPMSGSMPAMPATSEPPEIKTTGNTTNLLGYACTHYEIKQRGEVMEIWATGQLLPFQPYLENQPHHFGPHPIDEQWGELLKAKKNFPMLAMLKLENGPERMRFQVTSVKAEKIDDQNGSLFQPPPDYHEVEPLPF